MDAQYVIQDCVQWYLCDLSSWFIEQGLDVLIVVGHGIRTNPQIINAVNPRVVFLPNCARIVSPPQLGTMFEFHAMYSTLVMHHVLEQITAMHSELHIDNVTALYYVLHAW